MSKRDTISMNEELLEWAKEKKQELHKPTKNEQQRNKKPMGKCQICGEKNSKFICLKCNRSVCISCYFKLIGVCKHCIPKDTVEKWEQKYPDWEKILGVEWVD